MKPETPISEKTIFDGKVLKLSLRKSSLVDGTIVNREIITTSGAVVIVALTNKNEVRLVKQFRAATETWVYELPAGSLEPNEDPALAAPRELKEETGDIAATWQSLGGFYSAPGILTEMLHLFLATDLTPGDTNLEFDEHIENVTIPWQTAMAMINNGEIEDSKTIAGLMRAALYLKLPCHI